MNDKKENNKLGNLLDKIPFLKKIKNVKHIGIIVCIIFISLLLLICFSGTSFNQTTKTNANTSESTNDIEYTSSFTYIKNTEERLVNVLSGLSGVKDVRVMIALESGPEIIIAKSTEEETKILENGKEKNITIISTPIIVNENGENKPIILMEILPKISGVIVVANGADDVKTKLNIYSAIQTIISISSDKIQVFAGK